MKNKKAAMFGLDARIALAIFGALSVISGAALYKSIKHSSTVTAVVQIEELKKAIDQYVLDTGMYLPTSNTNNNSVYVINLYENDMSVDGWKGPYYAGKGYADSKIKIQMPFKGFNKLGDEFYMARKSSAGWRNSSLGPNTPKLCTSTDCDIYIYKAYNEDDNPTGAEKLKSLYYALEDYVDHNDGPGLGRIRAERPTDSYFGMNIYISPEWRVLKGLV